VAEQNTSQSALWRKGPSLICVILGEQYPDQRWLVKAYYNRGILWVFMGGILIGLTAFGAALRPRAKKEEER
jgi:cytochrome c biogenesis factor